MAQRSPNLPASSLSWPLTPARLIHYRMRNLERIRRDLNGSLVDIRKRREKNEQLIKDVIRFLNTTGRVRRIRPCDMDDPQEDACPASRHI